LTDHQNGFEQANISWTENALELGSLVRGLQKIQELPEVLSFFAFNRFGLGRVSLIQVGNDQFRPEASFSTRNSDNEAGLVQNEKAISDASFELGRKWRISPHPNISYHAHSIDSDKLAATGFHWVVFSFAKDQACSLTNVDRISDSAGFLNTIKILAQYVSIYVLNQEKQSSKKISEQQSVQLNDRRTLIASLLAQGWENRKIAEELGFSESLIRKETMAIFKYYGISHRDEMLSIHTN